MLKKMIYYVSLLLMISGLFISCSGNKFDLDTYLSTDEKSAVKVKTAKIEKEFLSEILNLQGNMSSKENAVVSARITGIIENIYVNEGNKVIKGVTRLFDIDAENIRNRYDIEKHNYEISKLSLSERQANYDRITAEYDKIKIDYERAERLFKNNVITKNEMELYETKMKQGTANLKHAETLIALAEEQIKQAEIAVRIAEKQLNDAFVITPVTGYISQKYYQEGEHIGAGKPVFRIDNVSIIEVSAFVSAEYYSRIFVDETLLNIQVGRLEIKDLTITYKSPVINERTRTFEIRTLIDNSDKLLAPGNLANIKLFIEKDREAIIVPKSAIINIENKKIIYIVDNNRAKQVEVQTGIESGNNIEIISDEISEGDNLIIQGHYSVADGMPVK